MQISLDSEISRVIVTKNTIIMLLKMLAESSTYMVRRFLFHCDYDPKDLNGFHAD